MKKSFYTKGMFFILCFSVFALVIGNAVVAAAEPKRVVIVPFKVNAEKDLTFLEEGIADMLESRLSWDDKVTVVNREETKRALESVEGPLNETKAREIGAKLDAEHVLFGSLTVFGNSLSIDAKLVYVSEDKPSFTFFSQSQSLDEVIPQINLFAGNINEKVFGRVLQVKTQTVQPQETQSNIQVHPEKLIEDGFVSEDQTDMTNMVLPKGSKKLSQEFWKSRNFTHLINGLALGDVDGDGKLETVIATPHEVHVYRSENNRFSKIKEIVKARSKYFIGLDIADINNNGYPEIFVTSLNAHRNGVSSFVIEYNGKEYIKIVKKSYWYYRVVELPLRGKVLFGQKQKTGGPHPFSSGIFEMIWRDSEYEPETQIMRRNRANLMGFTLGDVMNNDQETAVAYSRNDYIQIMDQSGRVISKGSEKYGGSTLYFNMPKSEAGEIENRLYFPMRILVRDLNGNSKYEVIAVRNHEMTGKLLEKFRKYTNSQIESLSWDGIGLVSNWETRKISGHIRDYAFGDFDNDGKDELIAAVIIKEGTLVGTKPKSTIIAYDLVSE